jgi:hypothetical protein
MRIKEFILCGIKPGRSRPGYFGGSYLWFSTCYVDENPSEEISTRNIYDSVKKYLLISIDSFSTMSAL